MQFFRIQIVEGEKWSRQANRQHYFVVDEPFRRGRFLARDGTPLIQDIELFHLFIDPMSIPEEVRDQVSSNIAKNLKLSPLEEKKIRGQLNLQSRNRKLAMWINPEVCEAIKAWWNPLSREFGIPRNALYFVGDYQRSYPFGTLLGPVLHTIQNQKDEVTKRGKPTGGLELAMNEFLSGKGGRRRLMRSPRHAMEMGEMLIEPEDGATISLTIDHYLQAIVEEELEKGVQNSKSKRGWAVMMEPKSGEILALAQYPSFDLSRYWEYYNHPELIEHTKVFSVCESHEPGSVMKPLTMIIVSIADQELRARGEPPLFDLDEKMDVSDTKFPGRGKPLKDSRARKYLNLDMAIQKSSNIYFARLVERIIERLGDEWYREKLEQVLGFGKKSGIELPAESPGLLPRIGKKHPNGKLEWSRATPFSLAMGHNILTNSIQLTRGFSLLANRGVDIRPTLIRKVEKKDEVLYERPNNLEPKRLIDREVAERIIESMRYVPRWGGTARKAFIRGYTQAGKTGTGHKVEQGGYSEEKYVSSFIGITPVKDPAFVLLVSMDEPEYGYIEGLGKNHHGGVCAAPVFQAIARRSLPYLGVPPDDPFGYPAGDPRYDPEKAAWTKELRSLQEMYESWNN